MDRSSIALTAAVLVFVSFSAGAVDFGDIIIRSPTIIDARIDRGVWTGFNTRTATEIELRGLHNMRVAGSNLAVTSGRVLSLANVAKVSGSLARSLGPTALAFGLAALVWDQLQNKWMVQPDVSTNMTDCSNFNSCSNEGVICRKPGRLPDGTWSDYRIGSLRIFSDSDCPAYPLAPSGAEHMSSICWNMPDNCPGRYAKLFWVPDYIDSTPFEPREATDAELEDAISQELQSGNNLEAQVAHLINSLGALSALLNLADPITFTDGPATAPTITDTKSVTGPEGTTTTITETTPHIQYSNTTNIINITNTTHVTVIHPDGTVEEETTEEQSDRPNQDDQDEDFCEKNPMSVLCRDLGDLEEPDLPEEEIELNFNKERSASGTCPSPITVTYYGKQITIRWDLVCQFAEGIRPIVLLVSVLMAGIWIFTVFRR